MNRSAASALLLATLLSAAATPALACGEGQFNTGQGMRYQGYLAPRPATVLVYDDAGDAGRRGKLYAGLKQAGHKVTVVTDAAALDAATAGGHFDVVIADFAGAGFARAEALRATAATRVLPVVARTERNNPAVRGRFESVLVDGASLGQYLKAINQTLAAK